MLGPWPAGIMEFTVLEDRQVAGPVYLCVCVGGGWNLGSRAGGVNGRVCVCPTGQPTTFYPPGTLALASARGFVRTSGFAAATEGSFLTQLASPAAPHSSLPDHTRARFSHGTGTCHSGWEGIGGREGVKSGRNGTIKDSPTTLGWKLPHRAMDSSRTIASQEGTRKLVGAGV